MTMKLTLLLVLLIHQALCNQQALTVVSGTNGDGEETTVEQDDESSSDAPPSHLFQPEKEWKEVKPGDVLPPGLHVRMDLTTGRKEARLLNEEPKKPQGPKEKERVRLESDDFKNFIKDLRDDPHVDEPGVSAVYRSMEEIKQEMSSLKLEARSESELLENLLTRYQNATPEGKVPLLQDMEFILHQYDAARDFIRMGGLVALAPDLNATIDEVRALVASTLGSAVQGNPDVQSRVLEADLLPALLRLAALDASQRVRSTSFFALSCLVRNFPQAQSQFLAQGGLSVVAALMGPAGIDFRGDYVGSKLALKALILLHDLVEEQSVIKDSTHTELLASIRLHGICSRVGPLLHSPELDTQEKVVRAMLALVEPCRVQFRETVPQLKKLVEAYRHKAAEELSADGGGSPYFEGLLATVEQLLRTLTVQAKEEL
ncbi:nucleotide exchange factor SIL1-like [Ornithodoros turicata]|uniref:nucleotide exchange factor SIL1-like n=1 Tax=Ornithodoros turicata TaxID=34597 RepID=UPI00313A0B54